MKYFFSQFQGKWYVIQGSNVASRCYTMDWTVRNGGGITVKVDKQLFSLRTAGIVHNFHYEAQVFQDASQLHILTLRFPSGKIKFQYTKWSDLT